LTDFPQPPNRTNHNALYGPIQDLFVAAKEGKLLVEDNSPITSSETYADIDHRDDKEWKFTTEKDMSLRKCRTVSASVLLRKLRWSTLGLQFDWSKVRYDSPIQIFSGSVFSPKQLNFSYGLIFVLGNWNNFVSTLLKYISAFMLWGPCS